MSDPFAIADLLRRHGQEHLLAGTAGLDAASRERFLQRLAEIDWEEMTHHAEPPPMALSTSLKLAMVVSPGVDMARAP